MQKGMNIVIAPHADDELIGAFSLIKRGLIDKVIYLDATPERYRAARHFGGELGFVAEQSDFSSFVKMLSRKSGDLTDVYLVPDASDLHPLHRAVNSVARIMGCKLGYYSVSMEASFTRELSKADQQEKRDMLNKYYPDQKSLWEHDWKYYLFEGTVLDFV